MAETRVMNCIMCPMGCEMTVTVENGKVIDVKGNTCPRGAKYANDEGLLLLKTARLLM